MNNGITALIISDPSPIIENKQGNNTSTSCVADDDNEIEEDDEDDEDEDDDADEEEPSNGSPKEKLAACSLCINVGYDMTLSNYCWLGKMKQQKRLLQLVRLAIPVISKDWPISLST